MTQSTSQLAGMSRTQGHNVSHTWTTDLKDKGRGKLVVRCWGCGGEGLKKKVQLQLFQMKFGPQTTACVHHKHSPPPSFLLSFPSPFFPLSSFPSPIPPSLFPFPSSPYPIPSSLPLSTLFPFLPLPSSFSFPSSLLQYSTQLKPLSQQLTISWFLSEHITPRETEGV